MNKTMIVFLLILIITLPFTGFELVKDNTANGNDFEDIIVGVYVTQESVNTFDYESYLNDHVNKSNNMMISKSDENKYSNRLYATYNEESHKYSFDQIEGILYATMLVENESESYSTTMGEEGICELHTSVSITDDGEFIKMIGTIYKSAYVGAYFFINPVYQDQDGKIYLTGGSGIADSSYTGGLEGTTMSQTLTSEKMVELNGENNKKATEITITIKSMFTPEKINLLEYNNEGKMIHTSSYLPREVPVEMTPMSDTEYILVEIYKSGDHIARELIEKSDKSLYTYVKAYNEIILQQSTTVNW